MEGSEGGLKIHIIRAVDAVQHPPEVLSVRLLVPLRQHPDNQCIPIFYSIPALHNGIRSLDCTCVDFRYVLLYFSQRLSDQTPLPLPTVLSLLISVAVLGLAANYVSKFSSFSIPGVISFSTPAFSELALATAAINIAFITPSYVVTYFLDASRILAYWLHIRPIADF